MPHNPILPAGPYEELSGINGEKLPLYIIPFDKEGACLAPETRKHLLAAAADADAIHVFSHGWNNDWPAALNRYHGFIEGVLSTARSQGAAAQGKCILVGIFWPSTALVFGEEKGPEMAGMASMEAAGPPAVMAELTQNLAPAAREEFAALSQQAALEGEQAKRFVELLISAVPQPEEEVPAEEMRPEDILEAWETLQALPSGEPQVAGIGDFIKGLDPRHALRLATVWMMKDRAGVVGFKGVGPLLRDLLGASKARIHLSGHSYGAKVVLSALCSAPLPRNVHSALLLQPAISHLCFAATVPTLGVPGGYHAALERTEQPICATFSQQDHALHEVFHLAVRRKSDLGEVQLAGVETVPSPYAALGGYGPRSSGEKILNLKDACTPYPFDGVRLLGLDGTGIITGHGDISKEATWWLSWQLIST